MAARVRIERVGRPSPLFARFARVVGLPLARLWHRARLEGDANLPATGPYLLVANHSGGVASAELSAFAALWAGRFGAGRPLAGFAHPAAFHLWPLPVLLRAVGAVPSSYAWAERAIAEGVPLLIFPGGDHEAFRPVWHANTVDFGGRLGFLKIARRAGIPIVPMGIRGGAWTAPVLWCSRRLLPALLLTRFVFGVKRYPLTLLGLLVAAAILALVPLPWPALVALVWAWFASLGPPLLGWLPATLTLRIGPPIEAAELFPDGAGDEALPVALARVEAAVQAQVDAAAARSTPAR